MQWGIESAKNGIRSLSISMSRSVPTSYGIRYLLLTQWFDRFQRPWIRSLSTKLSWIDSNVHGLDSSPKSSRGSYQHDWIKSLLKWIGSTLDYIRSSTLFPSPFSSLFKPHERSLPCTDDAPFLTTMVFSMHFTTF